MGISRVPQTFYLSSIQRDALTKPEWYEYNPLRVMSLERIYDVSSIHEWVRAALLDGEYSCVTSLQNYIDCSRQAVTDEDRSDWVFFATSGSANNLGNFTFDAPASNSQNSVVSRPPSAEGLSVGFVPLVVPMSTEAKVDVGTVTTQQQYNIGVMPNNHIRMTWQAPCFTRNEAERWEAFYPYILNPFFRGGCVAKDCLLSMLNDGEWAGSECLDAEGIAREPRDIMGQDSGNLYRYYHKGDDNPKGGGFAAGFGSTRSEAEKVYTMLRHDGVLGFKSQSILFEFVKYNGNSDMFLRTTVSFDLMPTGKLETNVVTNAFPLRPLTMRSARWADWQASMNSVLFMIHFFLSCFFVSYMVYDMALQYRITIALDKTPSRFIIDYFMDDWWNILDCLSTGLSIVSVAFFFHYVNIEGEASVFGEDQVTSWTIGSAFLAQNINSATIDEYHLYEQASYSYTWFMWTLALNSLCLTVRMIKFFGGVTSLRLMLVTISASIGEVLLMGIIMVLMLVGFVSMFLCEFGIVIPRFATVESTCSNLFLFVVGFFDVTDLKHVSFEFFFVAFILYEIVFLILTSMLLSAVVYRWMQVRKDATEVSLQHTIATMKAYLLDSWIPQAQVKEESDNRTKLDAAFWKEQSALQHMKDLGKRGQVGQGEGMNGEGGTGVESLDDGEAGLAEERGDRDDRGKLLALGDAAGAAGDDDEDEAVGTGDTSEAAKLDPQLFMRVFKRVHMEIASKMCRDLPVKRAEDSGAGMQGFLDDDAALAADAAGDDPGVGDRSREEIGILEDLQPEEEREKIRKILKKKLETADIAEEIWVDSLLSAIEEANGLVLLQHVFLPMAMILPKKPQEWGKFNEKKDRMEQRLNHFLQWIREEARIEHYKYLKRVSEAKVRMLKNQSLTMFEYLESLNTQIAALRNEITALDRQNAMLRARVSPLL